jgi:hypothetical protein
MIPSIVRVLGAANSALVPWGWGVNGATSVIGTSIATIVAMYVGFTATFLVGAVTYAGAGLLGWRIVGLYATSMKPAEAKADDAAATKKDAAA